MEWTTALSRVLQPLLRRRDPVEDAKVVYPDLKTAIGAMTGPSEGFKEEVAKLRGMSKVVNVSQLEGLGAHELLHPKACSVPNRQAPGLCVTG